MKGLVVREDSQPNTDQFWSLWELFADSVSKAKWIDDLDDERPWAGELVVALFLGTGLKENVRHWRSVEGRAHHVNSLFYKMPPSSTALNAYLRFLYHIGERSLPDAFIRLAHRLQRGETTEIQGYARMYSLLKPWFRLIITDSCGITRGFQYFHVYCAGTG